MSMPFSIISQMLYSMPRQVTDRNRETTVFSRPWRSKSIVQRRWSITELRYARIRWKISSLSVLVQTARYSKEA